MKYSGVFKPRYESSGFFKRPLYGEAVKTIKSAYQYFKPKREAAKQRLAITKARELNRERFAPQREAAKQRLAITKARGMHKEKFVSSLNKIKKLKAVQTKHPNPYVLVAERQRFPKSVSDFGSRFLITDKVPYSRRYVERGIGSAKYSEYASRKRKSILRSKVQAGTVLTVDDVNFIRDLKSMYSTK